MCTAVVAERSEAVVAERSTAMCNVSQLTFYTFRLGKSAQNKY